MKLSDSSAPDPGAPPWASLASKCCVNTGGGKAAEDAKSDGDASGPGSAAGGSSTPMVLWKADAKRSAPKAN